MKAHLVYIDLLVRVLVPDNATDEEIMDAGADKALKEARQDGGWSWFRENINDYPEDIECPATEEEGGTKVEEDGLSEVMTDGPWEVV